MDMCKIIDSSMKEYLDVSLEFSTLFNKMVYLHALSCK